MDHSIFYIERDTVTNSISTSQPYYNIQMKDDLRAIVYYTEIFNTEVDK